MAIGTTTMTEMFNLQGNFKINNFTFKPISTTELALYSGSNQVMVFDDGTTGTSDPIWGQGLYEEFILGSFYQTIALPENIVRLAEKNPGQFYADGYFTSVSHEFDYTENFQRFTASVEIPAGTNITAKLESSDDNFATIKGVLDIILNNGSNNYDAWALEDARYFRVTFDFSTTNTSLSPQLVYFEIQGITSGDTSVAEATTTNDLTVESVATIEPSVLSAAGESLLAQLENIMSVVTDAITGLPKIIVNGILEVKQLIAEKITAKKVATENLEMTDSATGEVYCVRITNGEWVKVKGECGEVDSNQPPVVSPETAVEPVPESTPASEEPAPEPTTTSDVSSPTSDVSEPPEPAPAPAPEPEPAPVETPTVEPEPAPVAATETVPTTP
ncbi:MAG: hypothetical protein Athens071424_45 [Parcubacteria group bacterium Athens0714_24]|nr:MAG: hypothetical protein Athens071424_45 [Parcubacteria group bacterium Athens0714_24]